MTDMEILNTIIKLKKEYENSSKQWMYSMIDATQLITSRDMYLNHCKDNLDIAIQYDNFMHIQFLLNSNILDIEHIDKIKSEYISCHRLLVSHCSTEQLKKYANGELFHDDYIFSICYIRLLNSNSNTIDLLYKFIKKENQKLIKNIIQFGKNKKHIAKALLCQS